MQSRQLDRKDKIILLIITVLAAIIRIPNYAEFSLSNDELSALYRTNFSSFNELIKKGVAIDAHPAGIQVMLFLITSLIGNSIEIVRIPFVFAGIFTVPLTYLVGLKWFGRWPSLFAASAICFLEFPLLFSHIIRPYGFGLFLALLMVYQWDKVVFKSYENIRKTKQWLTALLLGLFFSLNLYNHYFSGLLAILLGLLGFAFLTKKNILPYFLSGITGALIFLPHLKITLTQLTYSSLMESWLQKPGVEWPVQHILYIFNNSGYLLLFTVVIIIISRIFHLKSQSNLWKFRLISLYLFIMPMIIGYLYSILKSAILQNSVLIFSMPFLILFLFSFIPEKNSVINKILLAVFLVVVIFHTLFIGKYFTKNHFANFKAVSKEILDWSQKYQPQNITYLANVNDPWYIHYYLGYPINITFKQYLNQGGTDLLKLKDIIDSSKTEYLVYARFRWESFEIPNIINTSYPYIIKTSDFGGLSDVTLYSRNFETAISNLQKKPERTIYHSFIDDLPDTCAFLNIKDKEFTLAFSEMISSKKLLEYSEIKISVEAIMNDSIKDLILVFSINTENEKENIWIPSNFNNFMRQNQWRKVFLNYRIPDKLPKQGEAKVYVWNPDRKEAYIKNCVIEFYK